MNIINKNRQEAENPNWQNIMPNVKQVHDWRSYITPELRDNWGRLSLETRCALVDVCQSVADDEEWD